MSFLDNIVVDLKMAFSSKKIFIWHVRKMCHRRSTRQKHTFYFPGCSVFPPDRRDIHQEFTICAESHDQRQTLL